MDNSTELIDKLVIEGVGWLVGWRNEVGRVRTGAWLVAVTT